MLPPIRYPLPTLGAILLISLLSWQGAEWTKTWRARVAAQLHRVMEGPPVPNSKSPRVWAGSFTRRGLLLRDNTIASDRPGGSTVESVDRRMFVDVFDTWPEPGPTTHVRVGNRKAVGWVKATEVLLWDTRLVIRPPGGRLSLSESPQGDNASVEEVGPTPLPVLAWTDQAVEVATWDPKQPWSGLARRAWVQLDTLPTASWGVWISQVELPILLRQALEGEPSLVRLRAIVGRLSDRRALTSEDLDAARKVLPPTVFADKSDLKSVVDRLAEINARSESDAAWSGLSFRFLPLSDLP